MLFVVPQARPTLAAIPGSDQEKITRVPFAPGRVTDKSAQPGIEFAEFPSRVTSSTSFPPAGFLAEFSSENAQSLRRTWRLRR